MDASEFDDALEALARLLADDLDSETWGRAVALEVIALRALGDDGEASARLDSRTEERTDDLDATLAVGIELSEHEQLDDAERVMGLLCEADPTSEVPRYNLALALERQGRLEDAVRLYDEALARAPDFPAAAARKASTLRRAGRIADAAAAYRRYLELEPDDAEEWVALAITESELARWDDAYAAYARAAALAPDAITLHFNWAITASRRRDLARLDACVKSLERVAPDDWRTALARGYRAEQRGRAALAFRSAREAWQRSLASGDPDAPAAAARAALLIARRHGLADDARALADELFEHQTFDEPVLALLRALSGRRSDRALDFTLLVEGAHDDPDAPGHRYVRSYRVLARDADEACELALAFERRCGGEDLSVRQVERSGPPSEQDLGVSWRLSSRLVFSGEDDADEEDEAGDDEDDDR